MPQYTQEFWQKVYEGFETTRLLSAVDQVDELRRMLGDDEDFRPPEIRQDLLRLHQLAMAFVNEGALSKGQEMFDLAFDLDDQIFSMREALDAIEKTIQTLTELAPDPDEDYEGDDED